MHLSARRLLSVMNTVLAGAINIHPYELPKKKSGLLASEMREFFQSFHSTALLRKSWLK